MNANFDMAISRVNARLDYGVAHSSNGIPEHLPWGRSTDDA
jgi:hypothetical protein